MEANVKKIVERVQRGNLWGMKIYVKILRGFVCRFLPKKFLIDQKKENDFVYTTICSKKSFDMVFASLFSLYKNSSVLPKKIYLVSDGSWNNKDGSNYFKKYKLPIHFLSWNECASYYEEKCTELLTWAKKQIWGKKMASILFLSESEKVLFADPDVLWFNDVLKKEELENAVFKVSVDNSINYDQNCIKACKLDILNSREAVNCGVVLFKGGLSILNLEARACIKYESDSPGNFAEQTVFAALDLKHNNRWKINEITSEIDDLFNYMPFKKNIRYKGMIARHYLYALKGIYWKVYTKMLLSNFLSFLFLKLNKAN